MPYYRSIRNRRGRKKAIKEIELQLTPMMDVLTIILIFLLKSYSSTMSSISPVPGIKLPVSSSKDLPAETLQVVLTPDSLLFENLKLVDFAKDTGAQTLSFKDSDLGDGKLKVVSLYDSLVKAREKSEFLRQKSKARDDIGNPLPFNTTLSVQADKSIPYDIVRKVMYTSAVAGYKSFLFLAQKQPE